MPLSSNDQALVSQSGIEHEEFSGRPLDGEYTLRIWDSPDLDWNNLEDIQLVVNYEYWSQIQTSATGAVTSDLRHLPLRGHPRPALLGKRKKSP